MDFDQLPDHVVYSKNVIEFVTVTAQTCLIFEHAGDMSREDFIQKTVKLLPLLYLNASMVDIPDQVFEEAPEKFVTEDDYLYVREQIEGLLGVDDSYLDVYHPDMSLSDTPIATFVSENLSDVYQELKDFASNYQLADTDIMNDALVACLLAFGEHWGQKLLGALRALHSLRFNDSFGLESADSISKNKTIDRNSFLDFQQNTNQDWIDAY